MLNSFAHLGYSHETEPVSALDHCMPVIIGSGIIIALLIGVIIFLLTTWEPKKGTRARKAVKTKE
jgi:hypothetical protein